MVENMEELIFAAQHDRRKLNRLIENFLPFIKKCVAQYRAEPQSREDALTLAMLAFADSAEAYHADRGAFLPFAQAVIRNRLIDDFRVTQRQTALTVPLLTEQTGEEWETDLSIHAYARTLEQTSLRLEIEEISRALSAWNTSFSELAKLCPKQNRTRAQCQYAATLILNNALWRKQLFETRRLPSSEMCRVYGVSGKVLTKYRKYIATLCVIQAGDYPRLQSFLPVSRKEQEVGDE